MGWLSARARCTTLALAGFLAGCALAETPAQWGTWDLGAFRMQAPAAMTHVAGGADSQAGALASDGLRIDYDFGLYANALQRRDDMRDYASSAGTVDGLAARFVRFRLPGREGPDRSCSGVHVPRVRASSMGAVSLTVLACATQPQLLDDTPAIFASIRFHESAARP